MTIDNSRKFVSCDALECESETVFKSGHRDPYPATRGWIVLDKDVSAKYGILMGYRARHFCSRACLDKWIKTEVDNLEYYNTLRCVDDKRHGGKCADCGEDVASDFFFPFRDKILCLLCHGKTGLRKDPFHK